MDLDTLLLPVAAGEPCGIDLLHEQEYDDIASARQEDDPSESRGVWTTAPRRADWNAAAQLCETALSKRSKDLQVCGWLGEAWIAIDGIGGGIRAVTLLNGMCERFWPELHPRPRGQDYEFRTAPLYWCDRNWSRAVLLKVALVGGAGADARRYTLAHWNEAVALENQEHKQKDARKAAEKAGIPTYTRIVDAAIGMPLAALRDAFAGAQAWSRAVAGLNATLQRLVPAPGARLSQLEATLGSIEDVLRQCLEQHPDYTAACTDVQPDFEPISAAQEFAPVVVAAGRNGANAPAIQITGRAEAYRQLQNIAAYLARIEPHSPVPSLIRRAVDWGDMPFDKLMSELMENNGELQKILWRAPR